MTELVQTLWDQMRADIQADTASQINNACETLLSGTLGPLTEQQQEDLESIDRSLAKLTRRFEGEPINWADYSEAAHALRGPLNATIGFSRLMLKGIDGPITEAQGQALETIYDISRRMLALFNLLLDTLLFDEGMNFATEAVKVGEILDELTTVGETLAESLGFTFETNVKDQVNEITLSSDQKRLKQTLSALLAICAKYTSDDTLILQAQTVDDQLSIQLEIRSCQLPASLSADLPHLLTDEANFAFPYDVHLRLGLARRFLAKLGGSLEAQQTDETCTFTATLSMA